MNDLELYRNLAQQNGLEAVEKLGEMFAKSRLFGIDTPSQGVVMALTCMIENLTPVEFGKTYDVISGKLSMKAAAMHSKFQERGGRIEWIQYDSEVCEAKFIHKDYAPNGIVVRITLDELKNNKIAIAKDGGLKVNYMKFPRQMLRARVISEGVRMVDPFIVSGVYTPEEVSDFDDKPSGRGRKPLFANRREEPLETDAKVVDEPQQEKNTPLDLSEHEERANSYLAHLGWIKDGQTWRNLSETQKLTIAVRINPFLSKMNFYAENGDQEAKDAV
jgi:hypothetical protein